MRTGKAGHQCEPILAADTRVPARHQQLPFHGNLPQVMPQGVTRSACLARGAVLEGSGQ